MYRRETARHDCHQLADTLHHPIISRLQYQSYLPPLGLRPCHSVLSCGDGGGRGGGGGGGGSGRLRCI